MITLLLILLFVRVAVFEGVTVFTSAPSSTFKADNKSFLLIAPTSQATLDTPPIGVFISVISPIVVGLSVVTIYVSQPFVSTVNQSPLCDVCTHPFARAVVVFVKFPKNSAIASEGI